MCAHRCFSLFVMYFHDISIFRKKTYMPMLASDYNLCQSCSSSQKSILLKNHQTLISHNLGTSHQNLKKFQEFILTIRETKYVKINGF